MENATLIVMLALLQYVFFGLKAGLARQKHQVKAPATAGHEMFERAYRVQLNTLEQLVMFIPATFTYAWFVSPAWVLLPGGLFLLGRFLYARAYVKDPSRRLPGFRLTILANAWLIIGTLIGLASRLLA